MWVRECVCASSCLTSVTPLRFVHINIYSHTPMRANEGLLICLKRPHEHTTGDFAWCACVLAAIGEWQRGSCTGFPWKVQSQLGRHIPQHRRSATGRGNWVSGDGAGELGAIHYNLSQAHAAARQALGFQSDQAIGDVAQHRRARGMGIPSCRRVRTEVGHDRQNHLPHARSHRRRS